MSAVVDFEQARRQRSDVARYRRLMDQAKAELQDVPPEYLQRMVRSIQLMNEADRLFESGGVS
jgi:hypothetical protein